MNVKYLLNCFFSFIFLFSMPCLSSSENASGTVMSSANTAIIQTLLGLGLVVGVIYFLAWLLKRFDFSGINQNKPIKVVSAISLGAREKAILVDVKGQQLLLGVAPGRVSTLHVFDVYSADLDVEQSVGDNSEDESAEDESVVTDKEVDSLHDKKAYRTKLSLLSASSSSEFSKKLNAFLGSGNKS